MIDKNLYRDALVKPAEEGAEKLIIVSGYATSAMAFRHLQDIHRINSTIGVKLIVGMCPSDGISLSNHRGFQKIMTNDYSSIFSCSYIFKAPSVHSKLYIWIRNNTVYRVFIGSANYTQNAFFDNQREILSEIQHPNILSYYKQIEEDSIFCIHEDAEALIQIYKDRSYARYERVDELVENSSEDIEMFPNKNELESVVLSLLDRNGEIQSKAGLNWGQRDSREPNQAYIPVPSYIGKSAFFPPRKVHFTVLTDDGKTLICTRAQDNGKAIQTPHNNSLIGEYFRHRLGLSNGQFVTKEHLLNYGRTDVQFYKIDDENYYMDFSV